jgi:hypothetical protein
MILIIGTNNVPGTFVHYRALLGSTPSVKCPLMSFAPSTELVLRPSVQWERGRYRVGHGAHVELGVYLVANGGSYRQITGGELASTFG